MSQAEHLQNSTQESQTEEASPATQLSDASKSVMDKILKAQGVEIDPNAPPLVLKAEEVMGRGRALDFTRENRTAFFQKAISLVQDIEDSLHSLERNVETIGEDVSFQYIHKLLLELQDLRKKIDANEEAELKSIFQEKINPIAHQSEFCKYAYQKPRGYAGDFVMMEMIWNGRINPAQYRYRGETYLGQLINAFTLEAANCRANIHRVFHLRKTLLATTPKKIAAIGSGSAIEIGMALQENPFLSMEVHLFDQDLGALEAARQRLSPHGSVSVIEKPGNVLKTVLKDSNQYDFIYSSGLFDYFSVENSLRLIQKLWRLLSDSGTLVITNANPCSTSILWMEYVMDWKLVYKDIPDMLNLAGFSEEIVRILFEKDPYGVYQYLSLKNY